jgi:hypothetical protein
MGECGAMKESMPLLLTESLDPVERERTHQHIESCAECSEEWSAFQTTWRMMEDLPEVPVPPRVKARFLEAAGITEKRSNVVPFHRRPAFKWVAQAAAVVLLVGGGYFTGNRSQAVRVESTPAMLSGIQPVSTVAAPMSIAESRVLPASAISPDIEGRPDITNVQFTDGDASDNEISVAFDITSRWTVTGNPKDRSMVRILSYVLESDDGISPRTGAIDVVRRTYSDPNNADPEIAQALAKVLRNDSHEGVRIRAIDTLTNLPPTVASGTHEALIEALKSDPNPAVRLKAVEALANLARNGTHLDSKTVDTLRQKASQDDENLYVRVKAAEALSNIKP